MGRGSVPPLPFSFELIEWTSGPATVLLSKALYFSEHPKITQYSRSPSTRSLSVTQESPDSVHDMIDVAHAYIHHAVDQMYQSPPPLMNKPENLQNTKAMHAHQSNPTRSQSAMR